jgi:hypothetical protein
MNMWSRILAVTSMLTLAAGGALAAWSSTSSVQRISIENGGVYIQTTAALAGRPAACSGANTNWFVLSGTTESVDRMYELALQSWNNGRNITVWWSGSCTGGYAQAIYLQAQ